MPQRYQDDNGIARVNVRFEGEDVWLTQEQMMDLFDASRQYTLFIYKRHRLLDFMFFNANK